VNDVKEICELTLDVPKPPLRDPADALAIARRSARQRDRLAVAAAGVAVVAAASAAAVIAPAVTASDPGGTPAPPVAATGRMAVAPPAAPAVPSREAAHAHGRHIAQILIDAVPAGYTAVPEYSFADGDPTATWLRQSPPEYYGSMTSIVISVGGHEGLLQAFILRDGLAAPTGDLCSTALAARIDPIFGAGTNCRVVMVDGVPIRVTERSDPDVGAMTIAVRMLQGGLLGVTSSQGQWAFDSNSELPPDAAGTPGPVTPAPPRLDLSVFAGLQLAEVAGNPAMLP